METYFLHFIEQSEVFLDTCFEIQENTLTILDTDCFIEETNIFLNMWKTELRFYNVEIEKVNNPLDVFVFYGVLSHVIMIIKRKLIK